MKGVRECVLLSFLAIASGVNDAVPRGVNDVGPRGMNDAFPRGVNDAVPRGVNDAVPRGVNDAFPRGVNDAFPRGVNDAGPRGVNDAGPRGVNDAVPRGVNDAFPRGVNDVGPRGVHDAVPRGVNDAVPRGVNDVGPRGMDDAFPLGVNDADPRGMDDGFPLGVNDAGPRGVNDFQLVQSILDLYSGRLPSIIDWKQLSSLENEWTAMLTPPVSRDTAKKMNDFFYNMNKGSDDYHRTMDSVVTMCSSAAASLPYHLRKTNLEQTNRELVRLLRFFNESRTHLNHFKNDLETAADIVFPLNLESEIAKVQKEDAADLNNGRDTSFAEKGITKKLADEVEKGFAKLVNLFSASAPAAPVRKRKAEPIRKADENNTRAVEVVDDDLPKLKEFFSKLDKTKFRLKESIKGVYAVGTNIEDGMRMQAGPSRDELPSRNDVQNFLNKCQSFIDQMM